MTKIDDGGPAYARPDVLPNTWHDAREGSPGMSRREVFASRQMAAIRSRCNSTEANSKAAAKVAVQDADALIVALAKEGE